MIFLNFLLDFFKGILIGAGAILPGISSGVLCVILGIYSKLINCILNFFNNIKENLKFLFPIIAGIIVGIIVFGNILKYLFFAYPIHTKYIFIGLILGSIHPLIKTVSSKCTLKPHYVMFTFITALLGILLVVLENKISIYSSSEYSFLFLVISGFIMSAGVVIPGVSSTLILMLLGIYDYYINAISTLYIPFLLPLCIGLSLGSISLMKLTSFLLDKFYAQTFFSIIGLTIGSIFVLYPRIRI